jgi:hypothetical protein
LSRGMKLAIGWEVDRGIYTDVVLKRKDGSVH